jgi:hypothetical protein
VAKKPAARQLNIGCSGSSARPEYATMRQNPTGQQFLRGADLVDGVRSPQWLRFGFALALGVLAPTLLHAQGQRVSAEEFDALFQQIMRDPSDREFNLRFIHLALEIKDFEAAVAILDLLLFLNPSDHTLLSLSGEAYFSLKSYTAAKDLYQRILSTPDASETQRAAAAARLADIERLTRPSPWDLYAQAGVRYQTNATAGPGDLDGVDPSIAAEEDWNAFVLGVLTYTQPLGSGVTAEAGLTTYYADQFEVDRLDIGVAELVAGPRFRIAAGESSSLSLKPYGIASGVLLGDDPYLGAYGGGISARAVLGAPLTIQPYFEYRNRNYFDSDDYPTAADQTGDLFTYAALGSGALGQSASWYARGGFHDNNARTDEDSYDEFFADLYLRIEVAEVESGAWLLTPSVSAKTTDYGGPRAGDMGRVRNDFEWRAGARLDVPVTEHFGLGVQVEYTRNDSNLDRFDYDNLQVTSGPTVRF